MRMKRLGKIGTAAAIFVLLGSPAWSAVSSPSHPWDGVWAPQGSNMLDQSRGPLDPNYDRMYPPYRPEWEARYVEALEAAKAGKSIDPTATCVAPGMPRMMASPYLQEMIVKDKQVTLIKEYQSLVRRIYTDGRKPSPEQDISYGGYSVGRWEGDTLVVTTTHLRGDTLFDRSGAPHSDQIRVTERMRLISPDIWEDRMTIEDPVAFTAPWVVTRTYKREPGLEMLEYVCAENNRDILDTSGVNPGVAK